MFNQILCGSAAALLISGPVSALTMTPTSDSRQTHASAMAGQDSDAQSGFPSPDFSIFVNESSATASEFGEVFLVEDAGFGVFGASSSANARQNSQFGPLSISGSGSANADGSQGDVAIAVVDGGIIGGNFSANASSLIDVFFSIDESAAFDLQGFLSAGLRLEAGSLADGLNGGGANNSANILLINVDTNVTAYEASISNDSLSVNESGVLAAGNYRFSVGANASVDGGGIINQTVQALGDFPTYPGLGSSTAANFEASLQLSAIDKPIPEPVTTTLAGLGLGALALQTTRRRHRA